MRIGPFELDDRRFTLTRDGEPVGLSPRLVELLAYLAARPGVLVTKDELLESFWTDVHVTDNTLTRAVADIRKALGDDAAAPTFIQTVARRGYRFIAESDLAASGAMSRLAQTSAGETTREPDDDPFMAWVRGRVALESLDATKLGDAIAAFERATRGAPGHAPTFAGLANAELMRFESTSAQNVPDRSALDRALEHARQAITLDASLGEAWAVKGHILARQGKGADAQAPLRRAIVLEPSNWRHQYRLAFASWGEERLRAVDRTLALLPGFPAAHLLAAMVYVARQAYTPAEDAATRGADGQHQQSTTVDIRFPSAGLHWMRGLVAVGRGREDEALEHFAREVDEAGRGRVYGREFAVLALVADGFVRLGRRDIATARDRFHDALAIVAGHARATLGLALASATTRRDRDAIDLRSTKQELLEAGRDAEAALLTAGEHAWCARGAEAVAELARLVDSAPSGPAGWSIPVDPMLGPLRRTPGLDRVLAVLAARAA